MQENVKMFLMCKTMTQKTVKMRVRQYRLKIIRGSMPPDPPKISPKTQFGRTTFQLPTTALTYNTPILPIILSWKRKGVITYACKLSLFKKTFSDTQIMFITKSIRGMN